jgi:ethylbenzene dioxygenase beta subunit
MSAVAPCLDVPLEAYLAVCTFLYREARALDEERFRDWLGMVTDDIHYWMPIRENRFRKDKRPEPTPADAASVYNDDRTDLDHRVQRFESGLAWNEDPPARVRRMVTNIDVESGDTPDEDEEGWFVAARRDRLRMTETGLRLARRHIVLDHNVILDENLSVFL